MMSSMLSQNYSLSHHEIKPKFDEMMGLFASLGVLRKCIDFRVIYIKYIQFNFLFYVYSSKY